MQHCVGVFFFFFSTRRRHTRYIGDWSSDVCSSDLLFCARRGTAVTRAYQPTRAAQDPGVDRGTESCVAGLETSLQSTPVASRASPTVDGLPGYALNIH